MNKVQVAQILFIWVNHNYEVGLPMYLRLCIIEIDYNIYIVFINEQSSGSKVINKFSSSNSDLRYLIGQ
jgi:hypothetical protein